MIVFNEKYAVKFNVTVNFPGFPSFPRQDEEEVMHIHLARYDKAAYSVTNDSGMKDVWQLTPKK